MPYLNLDDNYPDHPKVEALSDAAYRLHGAAMFYVARYRLDGYLTDRQIRARQRWTRANQNELVSAGLIHGPGDICESKKCPPDDGMNWRLHDYFQWNKSREWWDHEREQAAKRKAEYKARNANGNGGQE